MPKIARGENLIIVALNDNFSFFQVFDLRSLLHFFSLYPIHHFTYHLFTVIILTRIVEGYGFDSHRGTQKIFFLSI